MSCSIDPDKITIAEVRDAINDKITSNWLSTDANESSEDVFNRIKAIQNKLTTELIDNSELTKGYHLDPSGKTMRYVWLDTKKLAFKGRTTDTAKAKYAKRRGANNANIDSKLPDNEIKANAGTKVHKAIEDIYKFLIANDPTGVLVPVYKKADVKDLEEIQNELGLTSNNDWNMLVDEVVENVKFTINTQKKIDPNGKVLLQVEATLFNKYKNIGGTADVHAVFSDKTGGLIDWKTITPRAYTVKRGIITDANWIPDYKMEDFNAQIPLLMEMGKSLGITSYRYARVGPIQMNLQVKVKTDTTKTTGNTLTGKIKSIKIGAQANQFLQQIPIILEDTGSKTLNKSLEEALILKNNLTKRASKLVQSSPEYKKLIVRIRNLNTSINQLMLSKDIKYVKEEYENIVKNYLDGLNNITKDIDNINSSEYLSNEKIIDLKADITIFKNIATGALEFVKDLPNLTKAQKEEYINAINILNGKSDFLEKLLQQKLIDRNLSANQQELLKGDKNLNWFDRYFRKFSAINNTIFKVAFNKISVANDQTRLSLQAFVKKLTSYNKEIEKWGAANGYSGFAVYKLLVNSKSGNLHTKIQSEFYDKLKTARDTKDKQFLTKHLKFKDNYKDIYEDRKLKFMVTNSFTPDQVTTNAVFAQWDEENNPDNTNYTLKYTDYWYIYQEVDESSLSESDYNPDFLKIKNNKPLLDYYNFWSDSMEEFRIMLDLPYNTIPNNFVPWIKSNLTEQYLTGNLTLSTDKVKQLMSVQENHKESRQDTMKVITEIDPDTGLAKRQIPRVFINPIVNQQGEIDNTLKSFDLSTSLTIFAEMAYNYDNLKQVESNMEALKEILASEGVVETTSDGNTKAINGINTPNREKSKQSNEYQTFERLVDFHLYGISDEGGKAQNFVIKAKKYQQMKELALSPISMTVNAAGARSNAFFEGVKGYYYTKQQFRRSTKDRFENKELYFALANFFQPYANKRGSDMAQELSAKKIKNEFVGKIKKTKDINYDTLMAGYRVADEHIDEQVMYSMLQNYTIVDGKLQRITKKDRESGKYKSILDSARIEGEDLIIDGILDKDGVTEKGKVLYNQFRSSVLSTVSNIKGGLNSEDLNAANTYLAGKLALTFRNWLPALAEERFRGIDDIFTGDKSTLRYSPRTGTITESRYTAALTDQMDVDEKGLFRLLGYIGKSIIKLGPEILTFGYMKTSVNENRAKAAFERFKQENPNIPAIANGTYRFEDFLEYKQGQIKALATELRFILIIYSLLAAMGSGGGDDDKYYKKNLATRTLYRILNRYRRELVGIINPNDWVSMFKNPVPLMGLVVEFQATLANFTDEIFDVILGEAENRSIFDIKGDAKKKDKTPAFYRSLNWIIGYKMFKWLDIFERDEKNK